MRKVQKTCCTIKKYTRRYAGEVRFAPRRGLLFKRAALYSLGLGSAYEIRPTGCPSFFASGRNGLPDARDQPFGSLFFGIRLGIAPDLLVSLPGLTGVKVGIRLQSRSRNVLIDVEHSHWHEIGRHLA